MCGRHDECFSATYFAPKEAWFLLVRRAIKISLLSERNLKRPSAHQAAKPPGNLVQINSAQAVQLPEPLPLHRARLRPVLRRSWP
jgi:hypothetical protein